MNREARGFRLGLAALVGLVGLSCSGLVDAAITEVAATTAASVNGGATTLSVSVPAGTAANDVLLVQISASKAGETITPPAGWTAIGSNNQSYLTVGITQALFYRVATGAEPASYAFSVSSAAGIAGSMLDFRGVDTNAPILGNSGQSGAALLDTAPSIASCQAGTMQVAFFGFSSALLTLTLGSGLTPYGTTSTNALVGLTIANGGTVQASAGTCPAYTALAVSLTANIGQQVALTPAQSVGGTVYGDANHDGTLGGGETGIGQSTYVKLASGTPGACQAPALQVTTANASTGAYAFATVNAGSYCLIASTNTTLSDVTATIPSGFVRTETPGGIRSLTVATAAVTAQNFGLYAGSTLAGRVFTDNGTGSGTANDGIQNGMEAGIASVTVNVLSGATNVTTATTDATGAYAMWIPSTTSGSLSVVETLPANNIATGGAAGSTSGIYTRSANATAFTFASGFGYTGVNFGNVPVNTFTPNNAQTVGAGATVPYAHSFVAGSAGQLTLMSSAASTPSAAWTQTIVLDTNCNGVVDTGEVAVGGAITVTAGQTVCIVVLDTSPATLSNGAIDVVTVTATLVYTGAAPALSNASTRTDTTTISSGVLLQLGKQVRNVTQATAFTTSNTASPNDVLEYLVTSSNPASGPVGSVTVSDTTPTYTIFVSASCPGTLPSGITACAVTTQPAVGATGTMQWMFTGTLAASGSVAVTYQVRVTP